MLSVIFCPQCALRSEVDESALDEPQGVEVRLLCSFCGAVTPIAELSKTEVVEAQVQKTGPRVVVGHALPAASRVISKVLRAQGYSPVVVNEGAHVIQACDAALPAPAEAVVLDVGIAGVLAFEVVAHLRAQAISAHIPIILLASVYERTRYKRRPNRLYGADDYLELHHVPDRLISLLDALRNKRAVEQKWMQAPQDRALGAPLRGDSSDADFARRLLSDVALYHGNEIARGVAKGTPFVEIEEALSEALNHFCQATGGDESLFKEEAQKFEDRLMHREQG